MKENKIGNYIPKEKRLVKSDKPEIYESKFSEESLIKRIKSDSNKLISDILEAYKITHKKEWYDLLISAETINKQLKHI